jgi:tellurite resistance protein
MSTRLNVVREKAMKAQTPREFAEALVDAVYAAEADAADYENAIRRAERRETVERIRDAMQDDRYLSGTAVGDLHASTVLDHVYAILDAKAHP